MNRENSAQNFKLPEMDLIKQIVIQTAKEELLPRFNRISFNHKADGTLNFSTGFPVFSVSLALIANRHPVMGIVYAAGYFIFKTAGGFACTIDGQDFFNGDMAAKSAVGACSEALFLEWKKWLGIKG
jgi:hypothetical protein